MQNLPYKLPRKEIKLGVIFRSYRTQVYFISGIIICLIFFLYALAQPGQKIETSVLNLTGNKASGEYIFAAAGCNSCHLGQSKDQKLYLGGGEQFVTPFGTFYAPNVSMSKTHGIGGWSFGDFYTALKFGQSPQNNHYYPAFPFTSYSKMTNQDIADLWEYWKTLPSVETPSKDHELDFPFNIRMSVGIWKKLFFDSSFIANPHERGTYLVEALGHCAECHAPRDVFGASIRSQWMKGAKNPSGKGRIPSIHPNDLKWTVEEISEYLLSGMTPDFDVAGGKMAAVIDNTAKLTIEDRNLIAKYLKMLDEKIVE